MLTDEPAVSEADRLKIRSWDINLEILKLQRELGQVNDRIQLLLERG